jgi:hypothetical protein
VTATAIIGQFSSLRVRYDKPPLEESRLIMRANRKDTTANVGVLLSSNPDGTDFRQLWDSFLSDIEASPTGPIIVGERPATGFNRIALVNLSSGVTTNLTNPPVGSTDTDPSFDPAGNRVVFIRTSSVSVSICEVGVDGTGFQTLQTFTSGDVRSPKLAGNGLLFIRSQSIFRAFPRNANPVLVITTSVLLEFDVTPDGLTGALLTSTGVNARTLLLAQLTLQGVTQRVYEDPDGVASDLEFSPDGSSLLFKEFDDGSFGVDLRRMNVVTKAVTTIPTPPVFVVNGGLAWAVAPQERSIVGPGAITGLAAADGVIVSRRANRAMAALAFDAGSPSTVVARKEVGDVPNPEHLTFSVDANSITNISYTNSPAYTRVTAVGSESTIPTATGFLVDFRSDTGEVGMVLPYTGTRASRSIAYENGRRVFRGEFLAVYDASGKNLAPSGAREVTLTRDGEMAVR